MRMPVAFLLACLVLLPCLRAAAQSGASPEEMEERGGLVYKAADKAPYTGLVQDFHQSGKTRLEASYNAGRLAASRVWYESGQLAEEVFVTADTWTIRRYQESGRLEEETVASFVNGRKQSERSRIWSDNGRLRTEVGFQGGKLHGPLKEYDEAGVLVRDELYDNGVLTQKNK